MSQRPEDIVGEIIEAHKAMVAQLEQASAEVAVEIAAMITETFKAGGTLYLCGNGGSAADAQHIAGEMAGVACRSAIDGYFGADVHRQRL